MNSHDIKAWCDVLPKKEPFVSSSGSSVTKDAGPSSSSVVTTRAEEIAFCRGLRARRNAAKAELSAQPINPLTGEREEQSTGSSHVTTVVVSDSRINDNGPVPGGAECPTATGGGVSDGSKSPLHSEDVAMPALDHLKMMPEQQRAEMEFSWELYLQEMNAHPVPHLAFDHVRKSLENGLQEGQFLEYIYPQEGKQARQFWYIELLHARGPEVFVRYLGLHDHPELSFWLDLRVAEVFPCGTLDWKFCPPKVVQQNRKYLGDLQERIRKGLPTPSTVAVRACGIPLKDRFAVGHWLEVVDDEKPATIWPAVVEKSIGGRLQLKLRKHELQEPDADGEEDDDGVSLWIFCTDPRLQVFGRGLQGDLTYAPPSGLNATEEETAKANETMKRLVAQRREAPTSWPAVPDVFQSFAPSHTHFQKGYYVEFLHPHNKHQIFPAVIADVFPDGTMAVEVLDFRPEGKRERIVKICRANSLDVLPVQWGAKNGVRLCPNGIRMASGTGTSKDFDWKTFVAERGGNLAPEKWFPHLILLKNAAYVSRFQRGMKLEVSNPSEPEELCTATVVKIIPPLLWVHIDSYGQSSTHIVTFNSTEMFPIGFCGSNDYPLKLPRLMTHGRRMATIRSRPASHNASPAKSPRAPESSGDTAVSASTPVRPVVSKEKSQPLGSDYVKVYVNPRCNCGPLMNQKKLTHLPQYIGPGPVQKVLDHVVTSLISCGSKQAKMLQMISATGDNPRSTNWERIKIKVKIGGRRQMSQIDVVKNSSQVPDFLSNICIQYEACSNLLTTEPLNTEHGKCPLRCTHLFTKPDPKANIIRKRPLLQPQQPEERIPVGEEEEVSPLDESMLNEPDVKMEPGQSTQVSQVDSDEDGEMVSSQAGAVGDYGDGLPDSLAASRTGSPETETPPFKNGFMQKLQREVVNAVEAPRKKFKQDAHLSRPIASSPRDDGYMSATRGKRESSSSSSSSDSDLSVEVPGPMPPIRGGFNRQYSDSENRPVEERLVDDSEYLLHFYKSPSLWSVDDVYNFLSRHLPTSRVPDVLRREGIDGDVLLMMCASDMKYLNLADHDALSMASLIERIVFSVFITQGQKVPLYANWK